MPLLRLFKYHPLYLESTSTVYPQTQVERFIKYTMKIFRTTYFLLALCLVCCKKPYNPPVISSAKSYLVVEGIINSGGDSTFIKLSKTVSLNAQVTLNPLMDATVTVESNQNTTWTLVPDGRGNYYSPGLNLSPSNQYRLRIRTSDGQQYLSDFMAVKPTPPIDSIGYTVHNGGAQLYVNTHDPANNTRYYRWDYQETWLFHSKYYSSYIADPATNAIIPRPADKGIFYCYANDASTDLFLNSTAKLSKDVVYQSPLTNIPFTSEKLGETYSILVHQYALTSDAYQFYLNIQKNTEQLGSIFDAEPSLLEGNIHNVADAAEPVIGYLSVTNVQSKRTFITNAILPLGTQTSYPYDCQQDTALLKDGSGFNEVQNVLITQPPSYIPTEALLNKMQIVIGYEYSTPGCTDCTLRGTTKQPSFWK